jgi:hypothetical protein
MDERELFTTADRALKAVIDQIKPEQWQTMKPDWFISRPDQATRTLRDFINYHAYDEAWVPQTLDGRTIEEVGDIYDGDLLGDDPKAAYTKLFDAANAAVKALTDLDQPVHLTYGDYPAREYLWHVSIFRGFRSYQLAKWLGADTTMSPELVSGLWSIVEPHLDEWRAIGIFPPAKSSPSDADAQTQLLAKTGYLVS